MSGIIVVTGSREIKEDHGSTIFNALFIAKSKGYHCLYQGGCRGADIVAGNAWVNLAGENAVKTFPADWVRGREAGPTRNRLMLTQSILNTRINRFYRRPLLLAFPMIGAKNRGTWNCILQAFSLQVDTRIFWMEAAQ